VENAAQANRAPMIGRYAFFIVPPVVKEAILSARPGAIYEAIVGWLPWRISYATLTSANQSSSLRTFTPSSSAFLSFDPAPGPATR